MAARQPTFFIPHGGGPCFFMPDPAGHWTGMEAFLRSLPGRLPEPPTAILVVSAHWETEGFRLTSGSRPPLIYDYYGFPPQTYAIRYDAPGAPAVAARAAALLRAEGLPVELDPERGFDHGVFVPLKVAFPEADDPRGGDVGGAGPRPAAAHRGGTGAGRPARRGRADRRLGDELPRPEGVRRQALHRARRRRSTIG